MKTVEERLAWLESNQPSNVVAINALRVRLGMAPVVKSSTSPKEDWRKIVARHKGSGRRLRITPYHHWENRDRSSN